jgi:metal-dependent hydrolase (beta-lactamase superfamily II)
VREGHVVFDHLCLACHGLSVLVTARKDAIARTALFDVPDGDAWLANAERLGVNLAAIELVFLSHVTVLSAWSHAGIVNAALGAQADFPSEPIDVLLGGYHLAGAAMERRIHATMRDLLQVVGPALFARPVIAAAGASRPRSRPPPRSVTPQRGRHAL